MKLKLFFLLLLMTSCDVPQHYFTAEPECISENVDDLKKENQKALSIVE